MRDAPDTTLTRRPAPRLRPLVRGLAGDRRVRFVATGGLAAVVSYTIFAVGWLLTSRWMPYLVLTAVTNLLTAVVMYPVYRRAVFGFSGPWLSGFLRFYTVFLWGLVVALFGMPLMVEVLHLHVLIAIAIAIAAGPLLSYQLHKLWAFRRAR